MKNILMILDVFDKYFLMLMLFEGITIIIYDYSRFKKSNMFSAAKKAKVFGYTAIIISTVLFITRTIFI